MWSMSDFDARVAGAHLGSKKKDAMKTRGKRQGTMGWHFAADFVDEYDEGKSGRGREGGCRYNSFLTGISQTMDPFEQWTPTLRDAWQPCHRNFVSTGSIDRPAGEKPSENYELFWIITALWHSWIME